MLDLKIYPKALQLLMQTDGTVTQLIKLLTNEEIVVVKLLEKITDEKERVLFRHIYLQGKSTHKNWLYAESKIYLNNLSDDFVSDLIEKTIPVGTLWLNYKMETFKQLISQFEEVSIDERKLGFPVGTKMLARNYHVFNDKKPIMEINEKFPIFQYENLL